MSNLIGPSNGAVLKAYSPRAVRRRLKALAKSRRARKRALKKLLKARRLAGL